MNLWTFHFDQGSVQSRITDKKVQDKLLADVASGGYNCRGEGWIRLPQDNGPNVWVNLSMTKAVTCQELTEAELENMLKQQENAPEQA